MNRKGIDIIIPVYNALDMLKECMDSIRKHVNLTLDRVILIDDCSPDQEVYPWMESLRTDGIIIERNERNQGFSGTVNTGLSISDRDVILLNSDTVVTAGFVEKLYCCAYSDKSIATVSPFSNAATICSIPVFCEDNSIPDHLSIDEYAHIVEKVSMRKYPQLTVTVGFCMFIKRKVIDEVGLFDQKTFRRGYGEENDFCWRASQLGYTHRLCDDTFIYHQGTASFISSEKEALVKEHLLILKERYPFLYAANDVFVQKDENAVLRQVINLFSMTQNGKKNILYILHNDYHQIKNQQYGGTELHVKDLEDGLSDQFNIFVAARLDDKMVLTITTGKQRQEVSFEVGKKPAYFSFHNEKLRALWELVIPAFGINLVHVHHLEGLSLDIYDVCQTNSVPVISTLHDFYSVCPSIKLINDEDQYCKDIATPEMCSKCLEHNFGVTNLPQYLDLWQNNWRQALFMNQLLIVPSHNTKDIISDYYPTLQDKITIIPHGIHRHDKENSITVKRNPGEEDSYRYEVEIIDLLSNETKIRIVSNDPQLSQSNFFAYLYDGFSEYLIPLSFESTLNNAIALTGRLPSRYLQNEKIKLEIYASGQGNSVYVHSVELIVKAKKKALHNKLNVACIGGITPEKGSRIMKKAIEASDGTINWFICGSTNDPQLEQTDRSLFITGQYRRDQLFQILKQYQIDIICIPAIWPETYSYTLSESWVMGLPVLAMDLGAIGERIKDTEAGWLMPPESNGIDLWRMIREISKDSDNLSRKQASAHSVKLKTVQEMLDEYASVYQQIAKENMRDETLWNKLAKLVINDMSSSLSIGDDKMSFYLKDLLNARENELRIIKATKGYRFLEKARHIYLKARGIE